MPRPKCKAELISAASENFVKLFDMIGNMTEKELSTPFDFSGDEKKKEAHWGRDKDLKDILVHLYEWQELLLKWISSNINGGNITFLPAPYNWKTYGDMNMMIWEKHRETELEAAKEMLRRSHNEVMALMEGFSDEELFDKGFYKWTGTTNLGSYFISTTSSHYDWAMKKLKAHKKNLSK